MIKDNVVEVGLLVSILRGMKSKLSTSIDLKQYQIGREGDLLIPPERLYHGGGLPII
jgi:hypothetical protein